VTIEQSVGAGDHPPGQDRLRIDIRKVRHRGQADRPVAVQAWSKLALLFNYHRFTQLMLHEGRWTECAWLSPRTVRL
jgi:hypothetical protein